MRRQALPIEQLQTWSQLNGVQLLNSAICGSLNAPGDIDKGAGLLATSKATASEDGSLHVLLMVPHNLILSKSLVEEYAKSDRHLRAVLEAVGDFAQNPRGAFLIFLLLQITQSSPDAACEKIGVTSPLTSYVQFLPQYIPLPTFYNEDERQLLQGTSLSEAVDQKLESLEREFDHLKRSTKDIGWCARLWWDEDTGSVSIEDWKHLDALYRSRGLDLPGIGHAMVPVLDLANHAADNGSTARFEVDKHGSALLVLKDGKSLQQNEEITIVYGVGGACEMLFSYGFLESSATSAREMFLSLEIPRDDPLRGAKMSVADQVPGVRVYVDQSGQICWESAFVWWACVNEEDGLDFQVLRANDGTMELRAGWKGQEIDPPDLEDILLSDSLQDVFRLRAVVTIQQRVEEQGELLQSTEERFQQAFDQPPVRAPVWTNVKKLRVLELELLTDLYEVLEDQKERLLNSEIVQGFLANSGGA